MNWYKCLICGYETAEPVIDRAYREPLRCADFTCGGAVRYIGSRPAPAWKLEDERLHLEKLNELAREMEQIIREIVD